MAAARSKGMHPGDQDRRRPTEHDITAAAADWWSPATAAADWGSPATTTADWGSAAGFQRSTPTACRHRAPHAG
jgi:hypothetical protein